MQEENNQQPEKQEPHLKNSTIALMVSVALFCDALGALLNLMAIGPIVTIVAYPVFAMWFYMKGIKLLSPKRLTIQGGTLIVEILPLISALPGITAMVVLTILDARVKEKIINRPKNTKRTA
ncbi:MAG: hypothetical protein Q8O98_00940 [bacterium]|nr:hypothetical protein [bacterium]